MNNLLVNFYIDKNESRNLELETCFEENLNNQSIDKIIMFCEQEDFDKASSKFNFSKVTSIITNKRPTYNDYFVLTKEEDINIIANLDIIIPEETIYRAKTYLNNQTCLALSRWDLINKTPIHFNRSDSQDTWIFKGKVPCIKGADYSLGIAGCDNSIAYLLELNGYNVINPSKTLKTIHLHESNIRNYINNLGKVTQTIPPPYKLLPPTE
jgi:hypothetical protein